MIVFIAIIVKITIFHYIMTIIVKLYAIFLAIVYQKKTNQTTINSKFGSLPSEDYYGDGDSSF